MKAVSLLLQGATVMLTMMAMTVTLGKVTR